MLPEPIVLTKDNAKKIDTIIRKAQKELSMVMLKSLGISVAMVLPILICSAILGMLLTPLPMIMGFVTAIMISVKYVGPRSKSIGEVYAKEIKEVIEDQRRNKTEES